MRRILARLFDTPANAAGTLLLAALAAWAAPPLFRWAVLDSVWTARDPEVCRAAGGACWAVIREKHRVMLFATYPYEEQWRGVLVVLLVTGLLLASAVSRLHGRGLVLAWVAGIAAALALQAGGVAGLRPVPTGQWGGLPLTMLLFVGTVLLGMPLACLLAFGRRSALPAVRTLSTAYIEVVRGVPLVNVLFAATLLLPLFLPPGLNPDKLLRVQVALALFFAAYTAEAVRGGLQSIPLGQTDAADALGIRPARRNLVILLPQALRVAIPALVNDLVRAFKNVSVLVVVGLFDVLGGAMAALEDPAWTRYYVEAYLVVALIYFAFCFALSQYSQSLQRRLDARRH